MISSRQYKLAALLFIISIGFLLRARQLGAQGLNEDEINKAEAAQAYRRGDFSQNREHPMLLKTFVSVSQVGARFWNSHAGPCCQITDETTVRLPNVIFGALTSVVIFVLAEEFFGTGVALMAAFVWSISPLAIAINRIAKEDTLLVFFTWLAYYFYVRAKNTSFSGPGSEGTLYALSGVSFGLMLASKYFPHYLGLIFLYYYMLGRRGQHYSKLGRRGYAVVFGTLLLAFLLANPIVLLPSTWKYMYRYVQEETMTHHGYLMMGHLYYNDPAHLLHGMPSYSYLLFLAIKTPLPLLLALLVGLRKAIRFRHNSGYFFLILMFTMWMVPFSLVVVKWFRYMLSLLPIVSILVAVGIDELFKAVGRLRWHVHFKPFLAPTLACIFLVAPLVTTAMAGPFYSLYLSPLGLGRVGYYFPHDELDDIGLREAIVKISKGAPIGAFVGGESAPILRYYLRRFHRRDLHQFILTGDLEPYAMPVGPVSMLTGSREVVASSVRHSPPIYALVQEGRKYFDNIALIDAIESHGEPSVIVRVRGVSAVRIYRLDNKSADPRGSEGQDRAGYLMKVASVLPYPRGASTGTRLGPQSWVRKETALCPGPWWTAGPDEESQSHLGTPGAVSGNESLPTWSGADAHSPPR